MLVLQKNGRLPVKRTPNFIINNFFNDAFFLKGLGNQKKHVIAKMVFVSNLII